VAALRPEDVSAEKPFPLRLGGDRGNVLALTALTGELGGGLFEFDERRLERIDSLASTGLSVCDGRVVRTLLTFEQAVAPGEVVIYDQTGVVAYQRIDSLQGAHDVAWTGREVVVVSTENNSLVFLTLGGQLTRTWRAPGEGDAWHLNGVVMDGDQLLVSAFGRFKHHRAWDVPGGVDPRRGSGILFDVESGKDVLTGLSCPHSPRVLADLFVLCDSLTGRLVAYDRELGTLVHEVYLGGWTRGIAVTDDFFFVGVSAPRNAIGVAGTAKIAVVDRNTWHLVAQIAVPADELYELAIVDESLVCGLRAGFRTNSLRTADDDQYSLFRQAGVTPSRLWATGDPLPPAACQIELTVEAPREMAPGSMHECRSVIRNNGSAILVSAPPNPVHVAHRWVNGDGTLVPSARTRLPRALPPGDEVEILLRVTAPIDHGEYILSVTLVQEFVRWFDEVSPANAWDGFVVVPEEPAQKDVETDEQVVLRGSGT
jgi:acetolactate synthase-1/2/3 large subunit